MTKAFLDSNVVVYMHDNRFPEKQDRAISLVRELVGKGRAVVSTQVLQEFISATTSKLMIELPLVRQYLASLMNISTVSVSPKLVMRAMDLRMTNQISIWDALIVVAAQSARCGTLYSEDMQHGADYDGLTVVNPFRAS